MRSNYTNLRLRKNILYLSTNVNDVKKWIDNYRINRFIYAMMSRACIGGDVVRDDGENGC